MTITDPVNLIAITGGIGSGKSVVAKIVSALGFGVYDCDQRARLLMEASEIKDKLAEAFGSGIFDSERRLLRKILADIVFSDPESLQRLNAITHAAVRADLAEWAAAHSSSGPIFVETAILYQSGIDRMVTSVWEVTAPIELRIERVRARNGLTRADVMARIEAQDSFVPPLLHPKIFEIVNDGATPILPKVELLLEICRRT